MTTNGRNTSFWQLSRLCLLKKSIKFSSKIVQAMQQMSRGELGLELEWSIRIHLFENSHEESDRTALFRPQKDLGSFGPELD